MKLKNEMATCNDTNSWMNQIILEICTNLSTKISLLDAPLLGLIPWSERLPTAWLLILIPSPLQIVGRTDSASIQRQ
jgi:hypothetical protein